MIGNDAGLGMSMDEMRQLEKQMTEELAAQNRKIIMDTTTKAFELRESAANRGVLSLDEFAEARSRLMEMQAAQGKEKLRQKFQKWDNFIAPVVVCVFNFCILFFCLSALSFSIGNQITRK